MRRIYDLRLVYDYIWGNDIEEYNIDDLENDPEFMLQVMEKTRDKKMYDFCSDSVKTDYAFVRNIIELFKDDFKFICNVVDTYLDSLSDAEKIQGTSYAELNIVMTGLCGRSLNEYAIMAAGFYEYERQRAKICINAMNDSDVREQSEAGFLVSVIQYENSPIILNFLAKRMINEYLYGERDNNLEYLIHSRFRSMSDFEEYGEVNFLYDCIYHYDRDLCSYVFDRASSVDFGSVLKEVAKVKRDWSLYMDRVNSWRVDVFGQEFSRYMVDEGGIGKLSYDEVVSYVANKLGVVDTFIKFDSAFYFSYDEDNYKILETDDVKNINKGIALATQLFSRDVIGEDYDDYTEIGDESAEIGDSEPLKVVRFQLMTDKENRGVKYEDSSYNR